MSKDFSPFSGYTHDQLLRSDLSLLLPKVVDSFHPRLVKKYLKKRKILREQLVKPGGVWLKTARDTVVPVVVNVVPRIDLVDGISLVALIARNQKMQFLEQEYPSVYCVIADFNFKVCHISDNVRELGCSGNNDGMDIYVHQVFKGELPEKMEKETGYSAFLDVSVFGN